MPASRRSRSSKPNLAAVAANPGALATLYQQGQIDIGPGNFNAIQILKARGVPVEFVAPKEGAIAFKTTIHIVKNSPNKEMAAKLIDAALSPEVQAKLMDSALPDRADQHQGQDGRRDRQGAGQGPRRHEEEVRVPGLEEDQRAARAAGSRSSTARSSFEALPSPPPLRGRGRGSPGRAVRG